MDENKDAAVDDVVDEAEIAPEDSEVAEGAAQAQAEGAEEGGRSAGS